MHSRIYQISKDPILVEDYICEHDYYDHWFTNSVADYVNGDTNRADDIAWLKECYENCGLIFGVDGGGEYFIIEDKTKYFADKFASFQKALETLGAMTVEEFSCNSQLHRAYSSLVFAYNDDLGFYVDEDNFPRSLDEFVRGNEVGTKFYIGATIDYHF